MIKERVWLFLFEILLKTFQRIDWKRNFSCNEIVLKLSRKFESLTTIHRPKNTIENHSSDTYDQCCG